MRQRKPDRFFLQVIEEEGGVADVELIHQRRLPAPDDELKVQPQNKDSDESSAKPGRLNQPEEMVKAKQDANVRQSLIEETPIQLKLRGWHAQDQNDARNAQIRVDDERLPDND